MPLITRLHARSPQGNINKLVQEQDFFHVAPHTHKEMKKTDKYLLCMQSLGKPVQSYANARRAYRYDTLGTCGFVIIYVALREIMQKSQQNEDSDYQHAARTTKTMLVHVWKR